MSLTFKLKFVCRCNMALLYFVSGCLLVSCTMGAIQDPSCSCGVSLSSQTGSRITERFAQTPDFRIVGGKTAKAGNFPWLVGLVYPLGQKKWMNYCDGSIVNSRHILTAAHCLCPKTIFPSFSDTKVFIKIGGYRKDDLTESGQDKAPIFVGDKLCHPDYHPEVRYADYKNDAAIVRLKTPIDFPMFMGAVSPICLHKFDEIQEEAGIGVQVAGWGLTSMGGNTPEILQVADLVTMNNSDCYGIHGYVAGITKYFNYRQYFSPAMICATSSDPATIRDSCQGDSGGPLMTQNPVSKRYEQIGIVSWGMGCGAPGYPGVYTRLSNNLIWDWVVPQISVGADTRFCSG